MTRRKEVPESNSRKKEKCTEKQKARKNSQTGDLAITGKKCERVNVRMEWGALGSQLRERQGGKKFLSPTVNKKKKAQKNRRREKLANWRSGDCRKKVRESKCENGVGGSC